MIANAAITIVSTSTTDNYRHIKQEKNPRTSSQEDSSQERKGGKKKYQILALAEQVVGKQSRIGDFLAPSKHLHGKIPKQPHTHNPEQNLP